jgi:hypothetical protein
MSLVDLWSWLESLPIAAAIGETWWFPLLESIHVLTATFLVGSILMVDLRLLGLGATNYPVSRVVRETVPWTYSASVISVITGVGLFIPRASHYVANPAFQIKLVLLVLAGLNMAIFHLATSRGMAHRDAALMTTTGARFAGASSLLLWVGVLLAGRWIGHLN